MNVYLMSVKLNLGNFHSTITQTPHSASACSPSFSALTLLVGSFDP